MVKEKVPERVAIEAWLELDPFFKTHPFIRSDPNRVELVKFVWDQLTLNTERNTPMAATVRSSAINCLS